MTKFVKSSINNRIKFKVSKKTQDVYKDYLVSFGLDARELHSDSEGYASMQLWDFMNIFGPEFVMGCEMPLETTEVLIEVEDDL